MTEDKRLVYAPRFTKEDRIYYLDCQDIIYIANDMNEVFTMWAKAGKDNIWERIISLTQNG